jgi:RNA 2',3'-cyclic 3'-phosphodiesterase
MRLFIATRIEDPAATRIERAFSGARARVSRASWVPAHAYHLTFAFLGDHGREAVDRIAERLPRALAGLPRYEGALSGGGFFPSERRPRVGWLAFECPEPLVRIAEAVRGMLGDERIAFDAKPFRPHLTVVRIRDRWLPGDAKEFLRACDALGRVDVSAGRVALFRSELLPQGARHDELAAVELA